MDERHDWKQTLEACGATPWLGGFQLAPHGAVLTDAIDGVTSEYRPRDLATAAQDLIFGQINRDAARVAGLERRVHSLESDMVALRQELAAMRCGTMPVVVVRELPSAEARQLVLDYYREHADEELYPSDVAMALQIDAAIVRDICAELDDEGLLA